MTQAARYDTHGRVVIVDRAMQRNTQTGHLAKARADALGLTELLAGDVDA